MNGDIIRGYRVDVHGVRKHALVQGVDELLHHLTPNDGLAK